MLNAEEQLAAMGGSLPKRKAAYVTIESLVNSQYNIDLQRLKEELRTLKARDADETVDANATAAESAVVGGESLDCVICRPLGIIAAARQNGEINGVTVDEVALLLRLTCSLLTRP